MITPSEAGITTDQHTYLKQAIRGAKFNVKLYQWHPELIAATDFTVGSIIFDATVFNDFITKVTPWDLYYNGISIDTFVSPDGLLPTPPSLVVDTDLYIFFATATGISLATFDGETLSSWDEIITNDSITFISAVASDTIHFITFDETDNNYNFHIAKYDGSWSVDDSDIFWGYNITSFSANRVGSIDTLLITSDSPGVLSVKTVGTTLVKKILPSGGIFGFTYKYETWSDHFEIDKIDQWSAFRYRSNIRVSKLDDTLWMTCYSSEGTIDYPITGYRIYSSKDGINWSRGELFPLQNIPSTGVKILAIDKILYAVNYNQSYIGNRTLQFGNPHVDTVLDITDKITELSFSRNETQQVNLVIDNQYDWNLDTIADGFHTLALKMQTGYASGTGSILLDTGIFEVDTLEVVEDTPKKLLSLSARDRLAWLTTRSQSEEFYNWTPQIVGVDEYIDTTGTGYGGLTHTATEKGSYKAFDGALQLDTSNEEGIAFSTWLYDNWNGSVETYFSLSQADNEEYGGLMFRSPDKDNGFIYRYNQVDDKLYLLQRVVNVDTSLWSSSAKSWDPTSAGRFLRADYRYSRILLYSSDAPSNPNANIDWVLENSLLVDGQEPIVDSVLVPLIQNGYVGTIGKGFSDQDDAIPDPDPIGDGNIPYPPYVPDDPSILDPSKLPPYSTDELPTELIVFDNTATHCHIATSIDFSTPIPVVNWTEVSTGLTGNNIWAIADPWNYNRYFALQTTGLYRNDNPFTGGTWTLVANNATMLGDSGRVAKMIAGSINRRGYLAVMCGTHYIYTTDYGANWNDIDLNGGLGSYQTVLDSIANFALSTDNGSHGGWIYAYIPWYMDVVHGESTIYKSEDWGATWTVLFTHPVAGQVHFPYIRIDGVTRNENDSSAEVYTTTHLGDGSNYITLTQDDGSTWNGQWSRGGGGGSHFRIANTVTGSNIATFTWDGARISFAGGDVTTFVAISSHAALFDTFPEVQTDLGSYLLSATGHVQRYSTHSMASLFFANDGIYLVWTVDDGTTFNIIELPSGYTGAGYAEWSLRNIPIP